MKRAVVIIPALDPDETLLSYLSELKDHGYGHILLVDDGSRADKAFLFRQAVEELRCVCLTHRVNLGKGRALKNAFNYYLTRYDTTRFLGVITADSDGQHAVEDVDRIYQELRRQTEERGGSRNLVLGARDFAQSQVPFKSRFGNQLTCVVMKFFYGGAVSDTQTGLRGISNRLAEELLALKGERFEYETAMLIYCLKTGVNITEAGIRTIYENANAGTHFRPIRDSLEIYGLIFSIFVKYSFSSVSAAALDLAVFGMVLSMCGAAGPDIGIWIATAAARIISSLYNYTINRNVVFKSGEKVKSTLGRYYMLVLVQMVCSAMGVFLLCKLLHREILAKGIIDMVLFFVSFQIQQHFIFV